jgi:hypothetical protein
MEQDYTPRGGTIKREARSRVRCDAILHPVQDRSARVPQKTVLCIRGIDGSGFAGLVLGCFNNLLRHVQISGG